MSDRRHRRRRFSVVSSSLFLLLYVMSGVFVVSLGPSPRVPRAGDYGYTQYTLMLGQGTIAVGEDGWGGNTSLLSVEVMSPAWSVMTNLHARRGCRGPRRWHHGTAAVPLWPLAVVAWIMLLRRSDPNLIPPGTSICERCGYPLYGITIDRCPECGEPVRVPSS